jgi:hypothetical protein
MKLRFYTTIFITAFAVNTASSQAIKILFDATKAQTAGNADWQVDADSYNLGPNASGAMVTGSGNEANPQRFPTPAQSGISSTTPETFWKGGLSAWGVECAKLGYQVETLPYNGQITYGSTTNAQDLSNYKIFVICEPNILYTLAQKQAIIRFVQNGGGLFIIADHTVSDRNGDSKDSPVILNDLMNNNGIATNPFGFTFDLANFSQTTTNFNTLASDPVLHGPIGNPTRMKFSNGTSMTLSTTANNSVTGLVYKTGSSRANTNAMMVHSHYGNGKVVGLGDSSCPDDGTGDTNDGLFNGWTADASGDHRRIILNATIWLTTTTASPFRESAPELNATTQNEMMIFPNPVSDQLSLRMTEGIHTGTKITIMDLTGREVKNFSIENDTEVFQEDLSDFQSGFYIITLSDGNKSYSKRFVKN